MAMPAAATPAFADDRAERTATAEAASSDEQARTGASASQDASDASELEGAAPEGAVTPEAAAAADDAAIDAAPAEDAAAAVPSPAADAEAAAETAADANAPATTKLPEALNKVADIDARIKALGSTEAVAEKIAQGTLPREDELLFLQRSLVVDAGKQKKKVGSSVGWQAPESPDAGYERLLAFANENQHNSDFLQWLLSDYETLQLFVTGGIPGGRTWLEDGADYIRSIEQFMAIAREHADDITPGKTAEADRLVYKKMMISAALGMTDNTRLWTGTGYPTADVVQRYEIVKTLRANAGTYHFQKELFDQLAVENMRWVFENRISNEEIPWLANYTLAEYPDNEGKRLNAYSYVEYRMDHDKNDGYSNALFYDHRALYERVTGWPSENGTPGAVVEGGWAKKYRFVYDDANFPNANPTDEFYLSNSEDPTEKKIRLWIPFEKGGVCGAVSKTCENLNGIVGVPAAVGGQPAHAACPTYSLVEDKTDGAVPGTKKPKYVIQNDSGASWLRLGGIEQNHLPCNWQQVHQQVNGADGKPTMLSTRWGDGSFILMAQDALNDMDAYTKAWELRQLADVQDSTDEKMKAIDAALAVQPFNWDVLVAKIELSKQKGMTGDEWVALAEKIAKDCEQYPYPMQSFMVRIEQEAADELATVRIENTRIETLERATEFTEKDMVQWEAAADTARRLLGKFSTAMFSFSFDGEKAGVLELGPQFSGTVPWRYSVDGGSTWVDITDNRHEAQLSADEVARITAEDDIKIRIIGVNETYAIDISEGSAPTGYTANQAERRIFTAEGRDPSSIEVLRDGTWTKLSEDMTFAAGEDVALRSAATGTSLASEQVAVHFEDKYAVEGTKVVPSAELALAGASSYNGSEKPERAIDGYLGTDQFWHNSYAGDPEAWIAIDLGRERTLTHIDYWNRGWRTNGMLRSGEVLVADETAAVSAEGVPDASAFSKVKDFSFDWMNDPVFPQGGQQRRITLDAPVKARYVMIKAGDTFSGGANGKHFTASEFQFFEAAQAAPELSAPGELVFGEAVFGTQPDAQALGLENTGDAAAVIDGVTVDSEDFAVVEGDAEIAPGATDATWKVAPKAGLEPGVHRAQVTATYHDAARPDEKKTVSMQVSIEVVAAERTIEAKTKSVGSTQVELEAALSAGAGDVEFALTETAEAPAEGWQADATFAGLVPETTYYARARVAAQGGYAAAQSDPVQLKTAAADGGGDSGDGDSNGGGSGNGGGSDGGNGGSGGGNGDGGSSGSGDGSGSGGGQTAPGGSGSASGAADAPDTPSAEPDGARAADRLAATGDDAAPSTAAAGFAGLVAALGGIAAALRLRMGRMRS